MKNFILSVLILVSVLAYCLMAPSVQAVGGKVRGDAGAGQVSQFCVHPDETGACPFSG